MEQLNFHDLIYSCVESLIVYGFRDSGSEFQELHDLRYSGMEYLNFNDFRYYRTAITSLEVASKIEL